MTNATYIKRHLIHSGQLIHQDDIALCECVVILAEPGAGKTELLAAFAQRLNTERYRANVFRGKPIAVNAVLVIDALDEIAKVDRSSAIESVLSKIVNINPPPQTVVLASRSSEWEHRNEGLIKDYLGVEPKIYRLVEFNEHEQRTYFESVNQGQSFDDFYQQLSGLDLLPLLGNPLFLKLFSMAYVEGGQKFLSKKQAFDDAVEKLAREHNKDLPPKDRPITKLIIEYAGEVFAKLLLSGGEGFSASETETNTKFPYLSALVSNVEPRQLEYLKDTGLFKLADSSFLYEPVHRVIAEYSAASYMVKKISAPNPLISLNRCLALMAPKGAVRLELRGLIGWMAALGNEDIQRGLIELDPYAVMANGDPSLLTAASKKQLLNCLIKLATEENPYFRASDQWRRFSVKGFFSGDVYDETLRILRDNSNRSNLRGLVVELLSGSGQANLFVDDLSKIVLDQTENEYFRTLCVEAILSAENYNCLNLFNNLVAQAVHSSYELAALLLGSRGVLSFGRELTKDFLNKLAALYPAHYIPREYGKREFIKTLIRSFNLEDVQWLLDELSSGITCDCSAKAKYDCECRVGISKVMGALLDRYFELATDPTFPSDIWRWTRNLIFKHSCTPSQSKAVETLRSNNELRRAVHVIALEDPQNPDELFDLRVKLSGRLVHSGLQFTQDDIDHAVQHAYETKNVLLWGCFYPYHDLYSNQRGPNKLRRIMKLHASENPAFMARLAVIRFHEKNRIVQTKKENYSCVGKWHVKNAKKKADDYSYFIANQELIFSGKHWGWLEYFADYYLEKDKQITHFDIKPDMDFVEGTLINGIASLESDVPSLQEMVDLEINNQSNRVVFVITAAVVAYFRRKNSLVGLTDSVLTAVKIKITHVSSMIKDDFERLDAELTRCLFSSDSQKEVFLRLYFEPQLGMLGSHYVSVEWLHTRDEFKSFKKTLPFEWLSQFPNMPFQALETLFAYAVSDYEGRASLLDLIKKRSAEFASSFIGPLTPLQMEQRTFWFIRYFYFVEEYSEYIYSFLLDNPNHLFLFATGQGRWLRNESEGWPKLSANKLFLLLDSFVSHWSPVDLPRMRSTEDPPNEKAYRFLSSLVGKVADDKPERSLAVLNRLIEEPKFSAYRLDALHLRAITKQKQALRDFEAPSTQEVIRFFDDSKIASVEDLRQLILERLDGLQKHLHHSEADPLNAYYNFDKKTLECKRVDENEARDRIIEFLQPRCSGFDVIIDKEQHMANSNRCDITAKVSIGGQQKLLVIEVKGQWHSELFTAAYEQLYERYAKHDNAAEQGIYLVLWFGIDEVIAGNLNHFESAQQLQEKVSADMPAELKGRIDIFVLDLSRPNGAVKPVRKRRAAKKKSL